MPIDAEGRRKQLFRRNGRGRPKADWRLVLTIVHETGESKEKYEVRAADKYEAARKAYQRIQEKLGRLLLDDRQNPRLKTKVFRQNGNGNGGGTAFVLRSRCSHYIGALMANGPSQMFKEVNGGGGNKAFS